MPRRRDRTSAFAQANELFALEAIFTGSEWLVPVVDCAIRVAGHAPGTAAAVGGSGASQFVGAWIERPDAPASWLPAEESPPDGSPDWSTWLLDREDLLAEIYRRIQAARNLEPPATPR